MKAAVMGYGTIGSGVVEVLDINGSSIAKRVGEPVEIKYVLDLRDFPGDPIQDKIVHDYKTIAEDPEVKIVVETMGGVEPAYTFVKAMLEAGKHVTTSNKALVAEKGADFDEVLKDAQAKGYAEKDPTADIEGYDACRKIAILTSLVCGQQVDFEDIHTEGITHISATDIKYAKAMGRAIKLLATSKKTDGGYVAMVAPFLLPKEHPLYNVNGVFNAIFVHGNVLGDAMFYGSGAGKLPTASAVVADVVEMAKNVDKNIPVEWSSKKLELVDYRSAKNRFFVRVSGTDKTFVEKVFGNVEYIDAQGVTGELGFVTEVMTEEALENKKAAYGEVLNVIRVA